MFADLLAVLARQNVAEAFVILLAIILRLGVGLSSYSGEPCSMASALCGDPISHCNAFNDTLLVGLYERGPIAQLTVPPETSLQIHEVKPCRRQAMGAQGCTTFDYQVVSCKL